MCSRPFAMVGLAAHPWLVAALAVAHSSRASRVTQVICPAHRLALAGRDGPKQSEVKSSKIPFGQRSKYMYMYKLSVMQAKAVIF